MLENVTKRFYYVGHNKSAYFCIILYILEEVKNYLKYLYKNTSACVLIYGWKP